MRAGLPNLERHIQNMQAFGLPVVVAINAFPTDTAEERAEVEALCAKMGVPCALSEVFAKGGAGGEALATELLRILDAQSCPPELQFTYSDALPLREKIEAVCKKIYRASAVTFSAEATRSLAEFEKMGCGSFPVCKAKTQYSFSDNAKLLAAPEGFTVNVRQLRLSAGAGFVVAICGNIMTMPGLPKRPAAEQIDLDEDGRITGLF